MKNFKKFFRSMICALIFTALCVHLWSNMMLDITYRSWDRATFGALGFIVCLSVVIISLGVTWYTVEHSKIPGIILGFLKKDGKACVAIVAAFVFYFCLKVSLTDLIFKLITPKAIGAYAVQIISLVTAVYFWPRRETIPEAE